MKRIILALFTPLVLFGSSITSEIGSYTEICEKAAKDPETFSKFRSHPMILNVIDTVDKKLGEKYLRIVQRNSPSYLNRYDLIQNYEKTGSPKLSSYFNFGRVNPTTLRYMKVTSDLKKQFGPLDQLRIVEIGGGYGGLPTMISLFEGFKEYTIVDLPQVLELAKTFLTKMKVDHVNYVSNNEIEKVSQCDLLVSNYAFSEIDQEEQLNYLNKLITKVPAGYMIINFLESKNIHPLSLSKIENSLKSAGYEVTISAEDPQSHPKKPNILLTWRLP